MMAIRLSDMMKRLVDWCWPIINNHLTSTIFSEDWWWYWLILNHHSPWWADHDQIWWLFCYSEQCPTMTRNPIDPWIRHPYRPLTSSDFEALYGSLEKDHSYRQVAQCKAWPPCPNHWVNSQHRCLVAVNASWWLQIGDDAWSCWQMMVNDGQ